MEKVINYIHDHLPHQHFSCCAVASINFSSKKIDTVDINPWRENLFYDLASLTKPLTLASTFLKEGGSFTPDMQLLLNHRAGLPMGGRLSFDNWQEQVCAYNITPSNTLYSDFSALRLQMELESAYKESLRVICSDFWDGELVHWLDRPTPAPITGMRKGEYIQGVVHDDNAFLIGEFLSHAGLFATVKGLAQSLLNLDLKYDLLNKVDNLYTSHDGSRFIGGWDRVEEQSKTLAGDRASLKTFGHLGFTGTSIWIDLERRQGIVLLTNATQNYWYDRQGLNKMRKDIHNLLWN